MNIKKIYNAYNEIVGEIDLDQPLLTTGGYMLQTTKEQVIDAYNDYVYREFKEDKPYPYGTDFIDLMYTEIYDKNKNLVPIQASYDLNTKEFIIEVQDEEGVKSCKHTENYENVIELMFGGFDLLYSECHDWVDAEISCEYEW